MLEAFQRIRAHLGQRAADHRAAQARAIRRSRAAGAAAAAGGSRAAPSLPVDAEPRVDVVVLDTIGELAQLYQVATVVFVGGSLVDAGGHNILEPAVFGKPIVFGPHMHNFAEIARTFLENRGAIQVQLGRRARRRRWSSCCRIRSGAPASAPPRGRWSKPIAARARQDASPSIAQLLPSGRARHGAARSAVARDRRPARLSAVRCMPC